MKPPIKYYGGKTSQAKWILDVMSRYDFQSYIEPFGGSGAVLFAKEPSRLEVYNDLHSDLVTMYRVLRNPRTYKQLIRFVECTPYSRELFHEARQRLNEKKLSEVERAWIFYVLVRQSFSGIEKNWFTSPRAYMSRVTAAPNYFKAVDRLAEVHERLKNVYIEHLDALECIRKYAHSTEKGCSLVYCDPPYVAHTRVANNNYKHEYTDEQHGQLVETLLAVPGHRILSGYESPIYQPLLDAGWTLETKRFCCHSSRPKGGGKDYRTECLYCSPTENLNRGAK